MTLNEALTECLRDVGARIEPGSCLWVMDKGGGEVWIYMETPDGEITSHCVQWLILQAHILMKKE